MRKHYTIKKMQQLKKIIKYKKIYLMQFDLHVYVHNTNSFNIV